MMMRVPLARRALDADRAVEVHHQPSHDGEPQTGAALFRRIEIVEDPSSPRRRTFRGRCRRPSPGLPADSPSRSTTCVETVMRPGFDCRLSTALAIRFSRIRRNATGSPTTDGRLVRSVSNSTCSCPCAARTTSAISAFRSQSRRSDRRRQPLVARGQRLEIRDAGIDRRPPLGEHRRKRGRLVPFDLRQMAHHVPKRDEAVLDVVVDLTGQLADRRAPFGLAHAGRAGAQPCRKVAEEPGQSADFVRAGIEVDVEAIEIEHGRLFGKRRQRPADSRRHPHRQQQRGDSGPRGGHEKP